MTKKTQKKLRKALTLISCAVLLVCITIGATVAYLTSSDSVTNTFTVGNVQITMDEADVNEDGTPIEGAARVDANDYHLLPGHTYTKDPTIHVDEDSEEAFLRVKVVFEGGAALINGGWTMEEIFTPINADFDITFEDVEGDNYTYILTYNKTIKGGDDAIVLFEQMTVPEGLSNETIAALNGVKMNITAYAVQKDGFENAAEAFVAANLGV